MDWQLGIGDRIIIFAIVSLAFYSLLPFQLFFIYFATSIFAMICIFKYEKKHWTRKGIPSPTAHLIFGNAWDVQGDKINFDRNNIQKFGPTFGAYNFDRRELTTANLDLIQKVLVEDFRCFKNKMFFVNNGTNQKTNLVKNCLSILQGNDWKRVRTGISPAFSRGALKKLFPAFNSIAKQFFGLIDCYIDNGQELPIRDFSERIGLSVVAKIGFSLDLNIAEDENSEFFYNTKHALDGLFVGRKAVLMNICPFFTALIEKAFGVDLMKNETHAYFIRYMSEIYTKRKSQPNAKEIYCDFFQLIMNAVADFEESPNAKEQQDHRKRLTEMELIAQNFLLVIAGFQATAIALQMTIYMLALHPDMQDKIRLEVNQVMENCKDEVVYEDLAHFVYMDQFIKETLRMYPPASRYDVSSLLCTISFLFIINRECTNNANLCNVEIGDLVNIPIHALHKNAEYFTEPNKFDPDRFSSERKRDIVPYSFLPFGAGPRNCIGMHLVDFQLKVQLAQIIRNFRFTKGANSEAMPITMGCKEVVQPAKTLFVIAERISKDLV